MSCPREFEFEISKTVKSKALTKDTGEEEEGSCADAVAFLSEKKNGASLSNNTTVEKEDESSFDGESMIRLFDSEASLTMREENHPCEEETDIFDLPMELQEKIMEHVPLKTLVVATSLFLKEFKLSGTFMASHYHRHRGTDRIIIYNRWAGADQQPFVGFIDNLSFPDTRYELSLTPLAVPTPHNTRLIGSSQGLVCLVGYEKYGKEAVVLWNPMIRYAFRSELPSVVTVIGFGVCPKTFAPKVLVLSKLDYTIILHTPFEKTKSEVIRSDPPGIKSVDWREGRTVGGHCYWMATKVVSDDIMLLSFDLESNQFHIIELPSSLTNTSQTAGPYLNEMHKHLALVVYTYTHTHVWTMNNTLPSPLFTLACSFPRESLQGGIFVGFTQVCGPVVAVPHVYDRDIPRHPEQMQDLRLCLTDHSLGIYTHASNCKIVPVTESLLLYRQAGAIHY